MPAKKAAKSRKGGQPSNRSVLTPEDRVAILARLEKGERMRPIAEEYGVTRQAISLIKQKALKGGNIKRLNAEECEKLKTLARANPPSAHDLATPGAWDDIWTRNRLHRFAEMVFKRRLMVKPIHYLCDAWFGQRHPSAPGLLSSGSSGGDVAKAANPAAYPPAPGSPRRRRGRPSSYDDLIPPPEFWEIANQAAFKASLASLGKSPPVSDAEPAGSPAKTPVRTGKHRKSKGSPFTASRKKRKKR